MAYSNDVMEGEGHACTQEC